MHRIDSRATVISVPDREVETVVRYGTWEALLRGTDVEVVHVLRPDEDPHTAEELVEEVVQSAEVLVGPGILVGGQVISGVPVASVLATDADASVVVVRERDSLHLQRAICEQPPEDVSPPVVCVPTGWRLVPADTRPVVAAVGDPAHAQVVLREGVELAVLHETRLRVVHAWTMSPAQERRLGTGVGEQWARAAVRTLDEAIGQLPDAEASRVDLDVVHGTPAEVVIDAAKDAQLLVLERSAPRAGTLAHLGRTARAALHTCPCPVLLLPPAS